jgi:hypothetical protein
MTSRIFLRPRGDGETKISASSRDLSSFIVDR